jgi:glutaredoxin
MSEQAGPDIHVFGTTWCGDCHVTLRFLDERDIPYRYHDIEEEGLTELVIKMNEKAGYGPRRRVPTVLIDDAILSVPTAAELAERLGIE